MALLSFRLALILLTLSLTGRDAVKLSLPNITWVNTLRKAAHVQQYLAGPHRMARETICLNAAGDTVLMGDKASGSLSMKDTLNTLNKYGKGHGIVLVIPNVTVYTRAHPILREVEKFNFVTLSFAIGRGPNGARPALSPGQLNQIAMKDMWPKSFGLAMEMTTGDSGAEKGYSVLQLTEVISVTAAYPNIVQWSLDFAVDAYHISWTKSTQSIPMLKMLKHIHFRTNDKMEDKVNLEGLMLLYNQFEPPQVYLNVPPKLQKRILDYKEPDVVNGKSKVVAVGSILMTVVNLGVLVLFVQ